jgi:hypothetical protein
MSNTKHKFAEDITGFALFILAILLIVILMSSCSTTKHSYYQDHLRSTPHHNFIKQDNGGCGWHN